MICIMEYKKNLTGEYTTTRLWNEIFMAVNSWKWNLIWIYIAVWSNSAVLRYESNPH